MRTPVLSSFPRIFTFAASLILTLLIASNAGAQTQITTGTIQGTVVDANGAVVPGANVEIKNLGTKEIQDKKDEEWKKTITDGTGKMKPIKELSPTEIANVIAYSRTLKK